VETFSSLEGVAMIDADNGIWAGRRVLVTGATGIVGSWLVKELVERSAEVIALVLDVNPQSELYRSDVVSQVNVVNGCLEDFAFLERAVVANGVDTVFHLGAQAIVEVARMLPLATLETNVRGTWNVLEVCRRHRGLVQRLVIASSDKAYGEHSELPYREDMTLRGRHPYEVSKSCADLIAQSYYAAYELPIAIARCGNIYGGGDLNWSRIVPGTIRSLHRGERPALRSDGNYIRDYIYVKDVVLGYLSIAENLHLPTVQGESFNFSPESRVTVLEIVREISRLMGRSDLEPVILNTAVGEIRNQYLSAAKALQVLGWQAVYTLEQGLSETIEWYRDFLPRVRQQPAPALATR
jgi:CDP-glucose 4,6-dehydratase